MSRRTALRLLGIGPRLAGGGGLTFLLRDDFTTAAAAPLASPRTAEPGPGTLTLVQTDGQFSASGGTLVFPAQATPNWGDLYAVGGSFARRTALTLVGKLNLSTNAANGGIGWASSATPGDPGTNGQHFLNFTTANNINYRGGGAESNQVIGTSAAATDYSVAIVLRSTGAFYFIKGATYTNWALLWVSAVNNTAILYPYFSNYQNVGTLDTFRVLDLPAPFSTDYGIATQRLAGARSAGDTFTHEADCVIEFIGTTMTGSAASLIFRWQDADNYWLLNVSNANIALYEVVAGSPIYRADASVTVSNGHRIVIVADGTTIRVYSNNVLRFTYSSASNFVTETDGLLATDGGGVISDIISWPRVLTSTPAALLDSAVA